ncbi:hypothetical protein [Georgenia sp. AZ-5]|uniref:hypothetical protein n=1 Tax=Georgenia sp. AZ-5 TaxID=3367526 RepID=UPI003754EA94
MSPRTHVASLPVAVAGALVLAGCTLSVRPGPRDVAITECRQMADKQTELETPGRITDIRALAVEGDEGWQGWEITGRHEETDLHLEDQEHRRRDVRRDGDRHPAGERAHRLTTGPLRGPDVRAALWEPPRWPTRRDRPVVRKSQRSVRCAVTAGC